MLLTKKMNSLLKVILFVIITVTGNTLFANENNSSIKISKGNDKTLAISFDYPNEIDIKITIKDYNFITLFKEDVKGIRNSTKTFDLKNLPNGIYFLEIEDEKSIFSKTIEIKNNMLYYNTTNDQKVNKPIPYINGDKLYVTSFFSEELDVDIVIYNKSGQAVYEETLEKQNSFNKIFKFIEGHPNDYTVSVQYKNRTFKL